MAKGVNKVTLLGNVGRDPEVKATNGGTIVANFSLATADRVKGQGGQWEDRSEWHNVVCFGRTAEVIRDYVRKGSQLYIEGKLQTRSWDDKQTQKKMYRTEIVGFDITLLGGKPKEGGPQQRSQGSDSGYRGGDAYEEGPGSYGSAYQAQDEDIPF